jgi:hypothetical protein
VGRSPASGGGQGEPSKDRLTVEREEVVQRHGDLEIEESMRAQRRLWKVQRAARVLALLLMALGVAGLFGGGPLSHATVSHEGFTLEYERVAYRDTPQTYRLRLAGDVAAGETVRIWVDRETAGRMKLEGVVPEPERSVLAGDRLILEFPRGEGGGQREVLLDFQSNVAGHHTARLGVEGGPTFEAAQLFLP